MRVLALTMLVIFATAAVCSAAGPRVMIARKNTHGTITLSSNGTYNVTGPAVVTYVNPHYTVALPATTTSLTVTAAGASGANWNATAGGKGCIISATVPITAGSSLTAKVGVKPAANTYVGGYGGGSGYAGTATYGVAAGGGSTSLATTTGNTILVEAGAGQGSSGGAVGYDAIGDGGGTQDATHGNRNGTWYGEGGGWTVTTVDPLTASSKIVSPATGTYATGTSGNTGTGYMVINY